MHTLLPKEHYCEWTVSPIGHSSLKTQHNECQTSSKQLLHCYAINMYFACVKCIYLSKMFEKKKVKESNVFESLKSVYVNMLTIDMEHKWLDYTTSNREVLLQWTFQENVLTKDCAFMFNL